LVRLLDYPPDPEVQALLLHSNHHCNKIGRITHKALDQIQN
jgi:hypothetical protein